MRKVFVVWCILFSLVAVSGLLKTFAQNDPANISVRVDEAKINGTNPDQRVTVKWRIVDLTTNPITVYFTREETWEQDPSETTTQFRARVLQEETNIRNLKLKEIRSQLLKNRAGTDIKAAFAAVFEVN